ncbi:hypothetical protein HGRIS_006786 [Hohenbuehelia grisea]|uniref:Uncharacterized protein n=1 Tax=Hohenbuehelia grisea TaxID=104357 RepID=A0ABR3JBL6_9AGAR
MSRTATRTKKSQLGKSTLRQGGSSPATPTGNPITELPPGTARSVPGTGPTTRTSGLEESVTVTAVTNDASSFPPPQPLTAEVGDADDSPHRRRSSPLTPLRATVSNQTMTGLERSQIDGTRHGQQPLQRSPVIQVTNPTTTRRTTVEDYYSEDDRLGYQSSTTALSSEGRAQRRAEKTRATAPSTTQPLFGDPIRDHLYDISPLGMGRPVELPVSPPALSLDQTQRSNTVAAGITERVRAKLNDYLTRMNQNPEAEYAFVSIPGLERMIYAQICDETTQSQPPPTVVPPLNTVHPEALKTSDSNDPTIPRYSANTEAELLNQIILQRYYDGQKAAKDKQGQVANPQYDRHGRLRESRGTPSEVPQAGPSGHRPHDQEPVRNRVPHRQETTPLNNGGNGNGGNGGDGNRRNGGSDGPDDPSEHDDSSDESDGQYDQPGPPRRHRHRNRAEQRGRREHSIPSLG